MLFFLNPFDFAFELLMFICLICIDILSPKSQTLGNSASLVDAKPIGYDSNRVVVRREVDDGNPANCMPRKH